MANHLHQAYELTLVLRSQIGDEDAFAELLRMYSPRLRSWVSKLLPAGQASSDDVLQEIWVAVFRALPKLKDAAAFRAWLYRIARDRVCREFRRARIQFRPVEERDLADVPAEADPEGRIDRETMDRNLEKLSPEHREVLVLRFMEEMSYDDIAGITRSTLGTVRSRIHYAKRALRRICEEKCYETKK